MTVNEADQQQIEVESVIQRILKRGDDPVWIQQTIATADPTVRAEVCTQFRENEILRRSFQVTAMLFDEVISAVQ